MIWIVMLARKSMKKKKRIEITIQGFFGALLTARRMRCLALRELPQHDPIYYAGICVSVSIFFCYVGM